MTSIKSYVEGVKARVEWVKKAREKGSEKDFEGHVYQLLEYLDGLDYFAEEEKRKMRCEICKNPLYERQDGSLTCVEMHH